MFKFSVWDFTSDEIDQIVKLTSYAMSGDHNDLIGKWGTVDFRKVGDKVRVWARSRGIIQHGTALKEYELDYKSGEWKPPSAVRKGGYNRWYVGYKRPESDGPQFNLLHDLPDEALWRLVRPIIEETSGYYTITHHRGWIQLGIWSASDTHMWESKNPYLIEHDNDYRTNGERIYTPFMRSVLNRLMVAGYIWFQSAGTVWQVTVKDEHRRDDV